jgi:hypothetical protein
MGKHWHHSLLCIQFCAYWSKTNLSSIVDFRV